MISDVLEVPWRRRCNGINRWALLVLAGALVGCAHQVDDSAVESRFGRVHFENSGAPEAQADFTRGVLLLHSFEYEDAATAFREAQRKDPEFSLAYWGEALTFDHPLWNEQDLEGARQALAKLGKTREERLGRAETERERDYLAAVEALFGEGEKPRRDSLYAEQMLALHQRYPDDEDAASLAALSLLGAAEGGRHHETYMRAAAIAEEVLATHPEHPGALHYLIHSYDDPAHAPLGLRAARLYADVAPDAVHALHMPTHIFIALGDWEGVTRLNERSWNASVARREANRLPLEALSFHALWWWHYAALQQGDSATATTLLELGRRLSAEATGGEPVWTHAMMRATHIINTPDPADRVVVAALDTTRIGSGSALAANMTAAALRAWHRRDGDLLRRTLEIVQSAIERNPAVELRIAEAQIQALSQQADSSGDPLPLLERAAELENGLAIEFGPPRRAVKPSDELIADVLSSRGEDTAAVEYYRRVLDRYPRRRAALTGLAQSYSALGDLTAEREIDALIQAQSSGSAPER